jgi:hypothetical protein
VDPDLPRTPSQVIGGLLTRHPEAASLHSEASHCLALARHSAAGVGRAFAAQQAARLAYEELRHRIDPRRHRTVAFGRALIIIAALGAALMFLDFVELSGTLSGTSTLLLALVASVAWLAGAWMAALASRERSWPALLAVGVAGTVLGLLLAALHGLSHRGAVLSVLVSVLILVLASGAVRLMARTESASLYVARRRWQQARIAYAAAIAAERVDAEAMAVATESWLGLVRTWASGVTSDGCLLQETVALAAALLEADPSRREQLPS